MTDSIPSRNERVIFEAVQAAEDLDRRGVRNADEIGAATALLLSIHRGEYIPADADVVNDDMYVTTEIVTKMRRER